jgi:hypothetical protein
LPSSPSRIIPAASSVDVDLAHRLGEPHAALADLRVELHDAPGELVELGGHAAEARRELRAEVGGLRVALDRAEVLAGLLGALWRSSRRCSRPRARA